MRKTSEIVCDLRCLENGGVSCCEKEKCEDFIAGKGCKKERKDRPESCNISVCYQPYSTASDNVAH